MISQQRHENQRALKTLLRSWRKRGSWLKKPSTMVIRFARWETLTITDSYAQLNRSRRTNRLKKKNSFNKGSKIGVEEISNNSSALSRAMAGICVFSVRLLYDSE
jgi:hypothetical protein